ncbi:MAG: kelch repeat-containing protein [Planctomycetota bacterium]
MTRPALLAVLLALPLSAASAQDILTTDGGRTGANLAYAIHDLSAGRPFLILTSTQRALIPLSILDGKDTRFLKVGLDIPDLNLVGTADALGKATINLPVPNDTSLHGLGLLVQAFTYPGAGTFFREVSDVSVVAIDQGGAWVAQKGFLQAARAFANTIPLGDGVTLYAGGGSGGLLGLTSHKSSELFDEASRTTTKGPDLTIEKAVNTLTELKDGTWLLAGGVDVLNDPQKKCDRFDPVTRTFKATALMAEPRMGHTATLLPDGKVLVAGGLSDLNNQLAALGSALKTTEIYDPVADKWTKGPDMSEPRAGHLAHVLPDGRIMLFGGVTWTLVIIVKVPAFTKSCDIYDPKTNKITAGTAMLTDRALFVAQELTDGRLLVAGGASGSITNGGAPTDLAEVYDPQTGKWTATGKLATARGLAVWERRPDGKVAVHGGAGGSLLSPVAVSSCELWDPKAGTWSALPGLQATRAAPSLLRLSSGGSAILGGGSGSSGQALTTWELFLP